jgi:class 3 adenylate cyclase/predicted ATPase
VQEIADWLEELGMSEYAQRFDENRIDLSVLQELTDEHLKELGVALGDRLRMLRAIRELSHAVPVFPTAAPLQTKAREATERSAATGNSALAATPMLAPTAAAGERRYLTVMFCDLVGSTGISAQLDAEEWRDLVGAYLDAASAAVAEMGGKVAKKLGDGLMALFGYPVAQENDAERAVRAALAIQRSLEELNRKNSSSGKPALAARIAIDLGPVVVDATGEIYGEVPNITARAQALAEPGSVVVTARVQRQVAGLFVAEERGGHELRGVREPVTLYSVVRASGAGRRAGQRHLTPLVGREEELAMLMRRWERARQGDGQLVTIVGEPGLGKSRLIEEFHTRLRDVPHTWVEWSCSQLLQNTPLHPVTEWGHLRFGGTEVPAERRLADLENTLTLIKLDPADVPLLAPLLDMPLPNERMLTLAPEELRRRQFVALTGWTVASARIQPVVLAFEDLHWADPTTLDLVRGIAERGALAPLFVLMTARPEFRAPWSTRAHHSTISLSPIDRHQVRHMVGELAARHALPKEVIEGVMERAGGVPLFVEEVTRLLLERGEQGGVQAIPPTLQQSLTARLDRLGSAREVAQIGAAIGRDFSYDLLQAVAGIEDVPLHLALDRLAEADILLVQGLPPESEYRFKHALIQDAASENLLKSRRQTLHRRIGEALSESPAAASEPEVIAHHFTKAGLNEKAVEWWGKAGDQALHRSAYVEAIEHLGKAIHLAESLPYGPVERRRRLQLQIDYGQALIPSRGHGALETTAAFARAEQLATDSADTAERFSARYGMWTGSFVRGEAEPMRSLSAAFLRDAADTPGTAEFVMGHRIVGMTDWFDGNYLGAREHLERAVESYDRKRHRALMFRYGQDIGIPCMVFLALTLWPLGEIVRARRLVDEAVTYASTTQHVATIAYALVHTCLFELLCLDAGVLLPHAESLVAMSRDRSLPFWFAYGSFSLGYARSKAGEREVGETSMRQGMAMCKEQGICAHVPLFMARQAEAEAEMGHIESALTLSDEAIALSERTGHHSFDAELHRVRGDTLLRANRPNIDTAETAFVRAVEIARSQHSKSFELRAAMSMARLWRDQGKQDEARDLLAPVYGWFTEGFDTRDLKEAKALLDELAP